MNNFEITIRPVTEADLLNIIELERICFIDPWPLNWFRGSLRARDHFVAVFNQTVGILGYAITFVEDDAVHIANLAVSPEFRRKGIGKLLVEDAIQFGEDISAGSVSLEVRLSNTFAINLYLSLGFQRERIEEDYYSDKEDALILTRELNGLV